MRRPAPLNVRAKIFIAIGAILAVVVAQTVVTGVLTALNQESSAWVAHTGQVIARAGEAQAAFLQMQLSYRGYLLSGRPADLDQYQQERQTLHARLNELERATADNPPQVQRWKDVAAQASTWEETVARGGIQMRQASRDSAGDPAAIDRFFVTSPDDQVAARIARTLNAAIGDEQTLLAERTTRDTQTRAVLEAVERGGAVVVVVLGVAVALLVVRSVLQTVAEVRTVARQIAHDDLPALVAAVQAAASGITLPRHRPIARPLRVRPDDELGRMAADVNAMVDRLAEAHLQLDALVRLLANERTTLRASIEASQDAVLLVDPAFVPQVSNQRFQDWFGVDAAELRSLPLAERHARALARVEDAAAFSAWALDFRQDPSRTARRRIRFSDGPIAEAECYAAPIRGPEGAVIGRVYAVHDISHDAALARTKDELVAVVSHELRTPLAALVGFAELLLTRAFPEEQRRQYLGVMLDEGQRLTTLINDFLDLQRLESGRPVIHAVPTDPGGLIRDAVAAQGDDPTHPLVLAVPADLPLVQVDRDRIRQVLVNLLANARKYSPAGGPIEIRAVAGEEMVEISVRDHGLGVPADALPHLFTTFYRVDNSDRRAIKGTGLGLAICRRIVEAHGGQIGVESRGAAQGSRFHFTVPVAADRAPGGDVLIVEDDAGFARLLVAELEARGVCAAFVASAEAALHHLATTRPRILLLDLILPGMSGEVLLRRIRAIGGTDLPVVVITVKDLDPAERRVLDELRSVSVMRKGPGVARAVAERVKETLGRPPALEVGR